VIVSDIPVFAEQIEFYQANDFVNTFPVTNMSVLADQMESRLKEGAISEKQSQRLINQSTNWTWMDVANSYLELMHER